MPYDCSGNYIDSTSTYSAYCCDTTSGIAPALDSTSVINSRLSLLCQVETAISRLIQSDSAEYQIGSRRLKRHDLNSLISLRDKLKSEIYGGIQVNHVCIEDY